MPEQTGETAGVEKDDSLTGTEFGRLDLLLNNAGISNAGGGDRSPEETTARSTATVWEVDVFGVVAEHQAMLPLLRTGVDARIVDVSSDLGSLTTNADPSSPYHAMSGPVHPASKAAENATTLARWSSWSRPTSRSTSSPRPTQVPR